MDQGEPMLNPCMNDDGRSFLTQPVQAPLSERILPLHLMLPWARQALHTGLVLWLHVALVHAMPWLLVRPLLLGDRSYLFSAC